MGIPGRVPSKAPSLWLGKMGTPDLQGLLLLFPLLLRPHGASAGSLHSPGELGKAVRPKSLLAPGLLSPENGSQSWRGGTAGALEQLSSPKAPSGMGTGGVLARTRQELGDE